ncbi:MAG: CotH kinase family protein, partial [Promethearchaeota archaeon]
MKNDNTEKEIYNKDSEKDEITKKAKFLRERIAKIEEIQRFKREKEARRDYRREIEAKKTIVSQSTNGWIAPSEELVKKNMHTTPSLIEKLRPSRTKRDLIPFIIIVMITLSWFIYFSYQDSTGSIAYSPEVPVINIDVSSEITNESMHCFLKFSPISNEYVNSRWANHYLAAEIRKRDSDGGFSFELYQNENLFQIRNDDDWLLLPPGKYLDSLRTKLAFDIYNMIQGNTSKYRLPETRLVEVYINRIYQGLYLLSERIDRKMMGFDQENVVNPEENDLIFKISNWDGDFFTIPNHSEYTWEQLYPNSIDFSQIPINLAKNVLYMQEKDFFDEEEGIFSIFNKNSIIDNLLFGLLLGHDIIEGSNYYLVLDQDSQDGFISIPWNFAQSWGYYKHGEIPMELWLNSYENCIDSVVWSNIYFRLLFPKNATINEGFITDLVNRWEYLQTNYWNGDNLISYFNRLYQPIRNTIIRSSNNAGLVNNIISKIEDFIMTRVQLIDNIFGDINYIFSDNFKPNHRENSEIFGFSSPAARRYYYKSSDLFSTERIHEVHVTVQRKYLNDMLTRKRDASRSTDRVYMPSHVEIDEYSVDNTGFRIRGTYNRLYPKDSFKLKFSEPDLYIGGGSFKKYPENEGRRFLGLRRLNLRAAPVDFSFMNEVAGYELYKILDYPCPRVSWAKLY